MDFILVGKGHSLPLGPETMTPFDHDLESSENVTWNVGASLNPFTALCGLISQEKIQSLSVSIKSK